MWSKHHIYTGSAFPDNILLILHCGQFLKHIQCLKSTEDELIQLLTEAFSVYAVSCSPSPPPPPSPVPGQGLHGSDGSLQRSDFIFQALT